MIQSSSIWSLKPVTIATLPVPGWECLLGRNDCTLRDIVFRIWIIRCGDRVGLIDTGCPSGPDLDDLNEANATLDPRSRFTLHRSLAEALRDEGIAPEAISFALITQLITYCTGGLSRENLPRATVYCAWDGMAEFLRETPGHPPRQFYLTSESWAYVRELLIAQRLVFADKPVEVAPGLVFEPTGGHHPGSAGVRIETERGTVGILETAFVQENIDTETPIGIAENAARCRDMILYYKKICQLVIAGHEPAAASLLERFLCGLTP